MSPKIRSYQFGEENEIVSLWNRCLVNDRLNLEVFERKIILDPNFEAEGFLLAEDEEELLGFSYNIVREYPLFKREVEQDKDRGWIVAFGITPESYHSEVGDRLVQASIEYHKSKGRKTVIFGTYVPNYFCPGVDADLYPHEYDILKRNGFKDMRQGFAMDANLWPVFAYPQDIAEREKRIRDEGIEIIVLTSEHLYPLMAFLKKYFRGDWYRHARELLLHNRKGQFFVAVKGSEVIGYCQFWGGEGYQWYVAGSHFGPFGVREDMRNRGIGSLLLYKCLSTMKENGIHTAFLLSTGENARRIYERFGFKVSRIWRHMIKEV